MFVSPVSIGSTKFLPEDITLNPPWRYVRGPLVVLLPSSPSQLWRSHWMQYITAAHCIRAQHSPLPGQWVHAAEPVLISQLVD